MRYYRFNQKDPILPETETDITDIAALATILKNATYDDWLEGLGTPTCYHELITWHQIGKFLETTVQLGTQHER